MHRLSFSVLVVCLVCLANTSVRADSIQLFTNNTSVTARDYDPNDTSWGNSAVYHGINIPTDLYIEATYGSSRNRLDIDWTDDGSQTI